MDVLQNDNGRSEGEVMGEHEMIFLLFFIWVLCGYLSTIFWFGKFGADVVDELKNYTALHHASTIAGGPLVLLVGLIIFIESE